MHQLLTRPLRQISCIGRVPLSGPLESLSPASIDNSKFILVKPTLQIKDEKHPKIFAIGDVAATGGNKNARSGYAQAQVVADNIKNMIKGSDAREEYVPSPFAIHMSTGLVRFIPTLTAVLPLTMAHSGPGFCSRTPRRRGTDRSSNISRRNNLKVHLRAIYVSRWVALVIGL
jgi:NADH dehydrogenase FAD-containing subunit